MDSPKVTVILKTLFLVLLFHSTCSQIECSGSEGAPVCNPEFNQLWQSIIMGEPPVPLGGEVTGHRVIWIPDPDFAGGYSVVVREVNNQQSISIFMPNDPNQFTIPGLQAGVEYEAMVCYDNITVETLPAIDEFVQDCGFCRTCFTATPESSETEPVFNREESTVQEFPPTSPIRFIYQCQATGVPPPLIRWNARNQMSGRREPITDNTARISITTFPPVLNEVSSTLTINQGADFNMPRCIAENSAGTIQLRADEFLVPGGSVTPGTGSQPVINLAASTVQQVVDDALGTSLLYHCEATGMPRPTIRWRATDRNGRQVSVSDSNMGIEIVMITANRAMDEAISELTILPGSNFERPVCEAQNSEGSAELRANQFVELAPDGAPVFILGASTVQNITNGELGTLTIYHCEVTGMPRPTITWRATDQRRGQEEPVSDDTMGIEVRVFIAEEAMTAISELILEPNSNFVMPVCGAENSAGSADLRADQFVEQELANSLAPIFNTVESTVQELPATSQTRYHCEVSGVPTPTIEWTARSAQSNQQESVTDNTAGISIITFPPEGIEASSILTINDGASFTMPNCIAENAVDRLRLRADEFLVISAPGPGNDVAPRFNLEASTVEEIIDGELGTSLLYHCVVTGMPRPTIRWRATDQRNGQVVPVSDNTAGIEISMITMDRAMNEAISQLTILPGSNFEMPICEAENSAGSRQLRADEFVEEFAPDEGGSTIFPIYAIILVIVLPVLLIAVVVLAIAMCFYRRRFGKMKTRHEEMRLNESFGVASINLPEETLFTRSPQTARKSSLMSKLPPGLILPPEALQVSTVIGQGEFGVVYKGYMKSEMMDTVAIKTLKGIFATASDIQNVSAEILKMQKFDHPNVMKLIGVCMGPSEKDSGASSGPCIVMPFMAKGSLLDYLRKQADNLFVASEEDKNACEVRKTILQMCLQVAGGMEYLSKLKFVHRDLAARNCLMDVNGVIKVSDFGLAEDIYSQNYFRQVEGGVKLPLKWMALESIKLGVFTEKTDVWSYGITCWEIFSGGSIPYPGVHPHAVLEFVEEGGRLARPKNAACCENMYGLMLSSWDRKPEDRPTFSNIVQTLSSYLESTSDYLDLTTIVDKEKHIAKLEPTKIEEDPEHSITRIPSNPNDYYTADPESSVTRVPSTPNDYHMADPETSITRVPSNPNAYYMADPDNSISSIPETPNMADTDSSVLTFGVN